jgi:hypothetical protein
LLAKLAWCADEKVSEIAAGLVAVEYESAIKYRIGIHVYLLETQYESKLEVMSAYDPGKAIVYRERIIGLGEIGDWQPHYELALEDYVFDPFDLGSQRKDASRSRSGHETLGG